MQSFKSAEGDAKLTREALATQNSFSCLQKTTELQPNKVLTPDLETTGDIPHLSFRA